MSSQYLVRKIAELSKRSSGSSENLCVCMTNMFFKEAPYHCCGLDSQPQGECARRQVAGLCLIEILQHNNNWIKLGT